MYIIGHVSLAAKVLTLHTRDPTWAPVLIRAFMFPIQLPVMNHVRKVLQEYTAQFNLVLYK